MKPIYFPFTYIPESVANALFQFLGSIIIFQPVAQSQPDTLNRLAQEGITEIRAPFTEDDERLVRCLEEFKEWGRLHHGEEMSLKEFFEEGFSRQAFTAQIRADILQGRKETAPEPDALFLSRLFLLMAQDLDWQQKNINEELASTMDDEVHLYSGMTGENRPFDPVEKNLLKDDFGAYMTCSRISAWCRLMAETPMDSVFLVTDSRSVVEEVTDKVAGMEKVWDAAGISCRQPGTITGELTQIVTNLAQTPWTGVEQIRPPVFVKEDGRKLHFSLYILPEADPEDVCHRMTGTDVFQNKNKNRWLNTLIGFFEI